MKNSDQGFALLISILVAGIVLAIGLAILNITLKQFILVGVSRESVVAFNAADAGLECAFYWDIHSSDGDSFDIGASESTITCMGQTATIGGAASGEEQRVTFTWGSNPEVCSIVRVTKYLSTSGPIPIPGTEDLECPEGNVCTKIESRGYNRACDDLNSPRTVERALRLLY